MAFTRHHQTSTCLMYLRAGATSTTDDDDLKGQNNLACTRTSLLVPLYVPWTLSQSIPSTIANPLESCPRRSILF